MRSVEAASILLLTVIVTGSLYGLVAFVRREQTPEPDKVDIAAAVAAFLSGSAASEVEQDGNLFDYTWVALADDGQTYAVPLSALRGPRGAPGLNGSTGLAGRNGTDGADGPEGPPGPAGADFVDEENVDTTDTGTVYGDMFAASGTYTMTCRKYRGRTFMRFGATTTVGGTGPMTLTNVARGCVPSVNGVTSITHVLFTTAAASETYGIATLRVTPSQFSEPELLIFGQLTGGAMSSSTTTFTLLNTTVVW